MQENVQTQISAYFSFLYDLILDIRLTLERNEIFFFKKKALFTNYIITYYK